MITFLCILVAWQYSFFVVGFAIGTWTGGIRYIKNHPEIFIWLVPFAVYLLFAWHFASITFKRIKSKYK